MEILPYQVELGFLPADTGPKEEPIGTEVFSGGNDLRRVKWIMQRKHIHGIEEFKPGGDLAQGGNLHPGIRRRR
jgi:hypothetical protein